MSTIAVYRFPNYFSALVLAEALFLLFLLLYGLGELAALRSAACQRFHPFFPVPLPVPPLALLN